MNKRLTLREIILGKESFILSHTEFKRALLTGQLCILSLFVLLIFLLIDIYHQIYYSNATQVALIIIVIVCFILNRNQNYTASKIILGISINLTVFIFSTVEPEGVGLHMLYIPTSLGALAAFGYEERWKSSILILLPATLFGISQVTNIEIFDKSEHVTDLNQLNLIINFFSSLISSVLIIYFLISLNHRSETTMLEHEKSLNESNSELSKLNAELDRFVYSTSHDLMAPLSSVKGLINLAKLTDNPKEIQDCLVMMQGRIENLQKFIRDISDYSRNTRTSISSQTFSVNKVIRNALENLQFYPNAEKINVRIDVAADLQITSDLSRFQIIVSNLISNAFKYSDISKENQFLDVKVELHAGNLELIVKDNGLGIHNKYLENIFEMFYQANEKSEGSGLGLYIVKQALEKLNGSINVTSTFGEGTTFLVFLPLLSENKILKPASHTI
jgi:signal transduction histidine kinase